MKKIVKFVAVLVALCTLGTLVCSAQEYEIPYDTYTYWNTGSGSKVASVNPIYNTAKIISANTLGIPLFESLDDVFTSDEGITYLLDGKKSEIIILDKNYNLVKKIGKVTSNGEELTFIGARNLYVKNDIIYISDTENERVLLIDQNGALKDKYLIPDSPIIPDNFSFKPIRTFTDSYGYVYILCDGSYYGAILYNDKHEFVGFYGSNTVTNGVLDSVKIAFNRMFINNTKKSATVSSLPYVFSDIYIDKDNFVYTTTGYTNKVTAGQIKKLSPGSGVNILGSDNISFVDKLVNYTVNAPKSLNQDLLSIEVDSYGYIYALDSGHGKIFVYDQSCNLIAAFGIGMHNGNQKGTFVAANSLTINGTDILVTDSSKKTVTVFKRTTFGEKLLKAGYYAANGDNETAYPIWQEIIKADRNCSFAYSGIAIALMEKGEYQEAMNYAKEGYDRETYALAFKEVRNNFLERNFVFLIIGLFLLIALIIVISVYFKRKNIRIKNKQVKFLFSVPLHPSKSFYKIQEQKMGSYALCIIVLIIYYLSAVLKSISGGFAFSDYDASLFNSMFFLIRSVGIIVLWIVCNWAVSAIFGGNGKIKEIAVVTCYSLTPMILGNILTFILSNILVPSEGAFIGIASTILTLVTLLLIVIGTTVIHDYDFKHFIGTTLLTILGMAIVVFLMIMIILLVQQLWVFLVTVFTELTL